MDVSGFRTDARAQFNGVELIATIRNLAFSNNIYEEFLCCKVEKRELARATFILQQCDQRTSRVVPFSFAFPLPNPLQPFIGERLQFPYDAMVSTTPLDRWRL